MVCWTIEELDHVCEPSILSISAIIHEVESAYNTRPTHLTVIHRNGMFGRVFIHVEHDCILANLPPYNSRVFAAWSDNSFINCALNGWTAHPLNDHAPIRMFDVLRQPGAIRLRQVFGQIRINGNPKIRMITVDAPTFEPFISEFKSDQPPVKELVGRPCVNLGDLVFAYPIGVWPEYNLNQICRTGAPLKSTAG